MTAHYKLFIATISFTFFCQVANGQRNDDKSIGHNLTAFQIDSICQLIDQNKKLVEGIAEGGFVNQKGGWETYDLKNKNMDTLFRIRHNSLTELYSKTTFYYYNKKVIKAIIEIEDGKSGNTMKSAYSATYYFDNENTIKVLNENSKYSSATEVLKKGQAYQKAFYKNR